MAASLFAIHKKLEASALYPQTLRTVLHIYWAKSMLWEHSSVQDICVYIKMADHDGIHRCLVKKNVPIALIFPSRWQDGAESLGMETTSCICQKVGATCDLITSGQMHIIKQFKVPVLHCQCSAILLQLNRGSKRLHSVVAKYATAYNSQLNI